MEEEKPRHERILDRMRQLVQKEVSKFSINGEGGITAQGGNGKFLLSGSGEGGGKKITQEPDYDLRQPPLKKLNPDEFAVLVGTVNASIPYILTDSGYVSIYGDGTTNSIPTIPSDDAEVWAKCTITPNNVFVFDAGPPATYIMGNMQVDFVEIVTTLYGVAAVENLATLTLLTGAVTSGTYYYWICSILDGVVNTTASIAVPRLFALNNAAYSYSQLTTGVFGASVADCNPEPDVTLI